MIITIRREAEQDIKTAITWYNLHQYGVGDQFLVELQRLFDHIMDNPQLFPEIQPGIRRALTNRFPYSIYYTATNNEIVIYAVLHQRRSPDAWGET
ncbi:MAG: type II toxin-antitoxin system RelE/ParE family toxin [Gammaproteobacteria bacterium]|nr:type II toxin-antitoxin system RelE/ParE family toxin [Gammaproteobacteria bacterium]